MFYVYRCIHVYHQHTIYLQYVRPHSKHFNIIYIYIHIQMCVLICIVLICFYCKYVSCVQYVIYIHTYVDARLTNQLWFSSLPMPMLKFQPHTMVGLVFTIRGVIQFSETFESVVLFKQSQGLAPFSFQYTHVYINDYT